MKKLFTAVLLLAALSSFAQGGRIRVINNSNCTVYYQIIVSTISLTPVCTFGSVSSIISIAAGTNVIYSGSGSGSVAIPGVTGPVYILGSRVFDGPTGCITTAINVGESCISLPLVGAIAEKTASCAMCSNITATWTPVTPAPGGTVVLTFN